MAGFVFCFCCCALVFTASFGQNVSDILHQMTQSQGEINTYYAKIKTTTVFNKQAFTVYSRIYKKGNDKSRIENDLPTGGKQILITNNGKCSMTSPMLKTPVVKDVGSTSTQVDRSQEISDFLNNVKDNTLAIVHDFGSGRYELLGESKGGDTRVHCVDFIIDVNKKCIEELKLKDKNNEILAEYIISSVKIKNMWTVNKMIITSNSNNGMAIKIDIDYENIKINEEMNESLFFING